MKVLSVLLLKELVADLSLVNKMLKYISEGNWD